MLTQKISEVEANNREMEKDIKLLKRLQHHQGNRLQDLDDSERFPEKMKQLMEEKKWAQDRVRELHKKREHETNHLNRQNEIVG